MVYNIPEELTPRPGTAGGRPPSVRLGERGEKEEDEMAKQDAQISFRATKQFKQELEAQAKKEHLSASGLILKALQAYLESCGAQLER